MPEVELTGAAAEAAAARKHTHTIMSRTFYLIPTRTVKHTGLPNVGGNLGGLKSHFCFDGCVGQDAQICF